LGSSCNPFASFKTFQEDSDELRLVGSAISGHGPQFEQARGTYALGELSEAYGGEICPEKQC